MTPKEKAEYLIDTFGDDLAIKLVGEFLDATLGYLDECHSVVNYWQQTKNDIKKLIKNRPTMEENKYYTPTIEEFCVGFEYETRHKMTYQKAIVKTTTDLVLIERILQNEDPSFGIRVKKLDIDDIEDCGMGFRMDCIYAHINKDDVYIEYSDLEDLSKQEIRIYNSQDPLFKGLIKNKTELIKTLNRLRLLK